MTPHDFPVLAKWMMQIPLWQRYGLTEERAIQNFEQGLRQEDDLWVVVSGNNAVGFVWVMPKGLFGRSPYVRLIGVNPDIKRSGLGSALLNHAERRVSAFAKDIFLLVSDFNLDAQAFYKRQGYVQVGALENYVLTGVNELLFRKVFE